MNAEMPIGTHLETSETAYLRAPKLNRHTFWCGQSGSGKTYALGVVLEQVLLHTHLPLVILDPNSDFVHLDSPQDSASEEAAAQLASRDVRILRPSSPGDRHLQVRFVDMDIRSRAAVLQLDPVLDAEEYNAMLRVGAEYTFGDDRGLATWLENHEDPLLRRLALRLQNLGVLEWDMWAWGGRDATDVINELPDATVVDLGGFDSAAQLQASALAVLDRLWAQRHERTGRLVVIDEAHNLAAPDAGTPLARALTERIVQIAAEGRKYGIWLLLSTQRPSKLHPNVISQCDNLALMKMSSTRDLDELGQIFGFAPSELLERSPRFTQGQALFAGGFASEPQLVQMGERLTREGGSDVPIGLR
ncbi:ATP-binding protein [Brachybacterium sp. YJGR34]|uniref:ATP-binding protein n=1 Tax=Brachybacterium sp. YJGR34 TaxID=2059911 RepID=UPI000E0C351A|nr:ATP-binding protein [Brachybacterium sp. YJGR34]